jgi:hypothetical protein
MPFSLILQVTGTIFPALINSSFGIKVRSLDIFFSSLDCKNNNKRLSKMCGLKSQP